MASESMDPVHDCNGATHARIGARAHARVSDGNMWERRERRVMGTSSFSASLSSRSKMDPLPGPGSNQLMPCARRVARAGEESEEERAHLF